MQLLVIDDLLRSHYRGPSGGGSILVVLVSFFVIAPITFMLAAAKTVASAGKLAKFYAFAAVFSALHYLIVGYILAMPDVSLNRGGLSILEWIYLRR